MGCCVRVFIVILLLLCVGCAIASCLTDSFRYGKDNSAVFLLASFLSGEDPKLHVQYFQIRGSIPDGSAQINKVWDLLGKDCKQRMTIAGALCAAGGGVGLLCLILEGVYLACTNNCCFSCCIMLLLFVAFGCSGAAVGLSVSAVVGDDRACPVLDKGFVEGFGLVCAQTGLFLIATVLQLCA